MTENGMLSTAMDDTTSDTSLERRPTADDHLEPGYITSDQPARAIQEPNFIPSRASRLEAIADSAGQSVRVPDPAVLASHVAEDIIFEDVIRSRVSLPADVSDSTLERNPGSVPLDTRLPDPTIIPVTGGNATGDPLTRRRATLGVAGIIDDAQARTSSPASTNAAAELIKRNGKLGFILQKPNYRVVFVPVKTLDGRLFESKEETLLKAARYGHKDTVALMLSEGADLEYSDTKDESLKTALLYAAEGHNPITVRYLLDKKADWNARDKAGRNALHLASFNGNTEVVQIILDVHHIEVNVRDTLFETPLHLASKSGHIDIMQVLITHGANINAKDKKRFTPLHYAAKRSGAVVNVLLHYEALPIDEMSNFGRTPLMQACERPPSQESEEVVGHLIARHADPKAHANNGETPLYLAASSNNLPVVDRLIRCGVDINAVTDEGLSALFGPARFGFDETAKLLLDSRINSTIVDNAGRTALLEAAKYDKIKVLRLIFEAIDTKERGGLAQSALFEASIYDSSEVARFLLDNGANTSEKDAARQETAVEIANRYASQKVVALLLEKGGQLVSQGPMIGESLLDAPSEAGPNPLSLSDGKLDLGFGFKSTIVAFSVENRERSTISRPLLRKVLYDHSPDAIRSGLQSASSTGKNFRWLHIPSNNIVWINNLMTRMYKECYPEDRAAYFQKKCKHLFGEEHWTRHQYQSSSTSVAHRRFIRPICQRIDMSETDNNNMMMVFPYFHWETAKGRDEMTDVIIEAIKRQIDNPLLTSTSNMKGLSEALKALEKARDPDEPANDDNESGYLSSSYYTDAWTATSSSSDDRRTRDSRRPRRDPEKTRSLAGTDADADADADDVLVAKLTRETLENELNQKEEGIVSRTKEEKRRKNRIERIVNVAKERRSQDEKLILAYMFDDIPLHFRRTLDQYYYYTLATTEARDTDQVVSRYFDKTWPDEENLVLMVDQLWLWILDDETVVTSFPQRWNKSKEKDDDDPDPDNTSDIVDTIVRHIGKRDRRPITSVYDLAELIVSKCTSTMFEHADVSNEKLRFSEFFEVSIGNVTNAESEMFNEFSELSEKLAAGDQMTTDLDRLFNISKETKLLGQIKDIRDELHIISTVLTDQERVAESMENTIQAMKDGTTETSSEYGKTKVPQPMRRNQYNLLERVRRHIAVVEGLDKQAEKTYLALKDLLDLKQKQANVSEARSQRQQAVATTKQGRVLMLFTIITVFFLPLSFLTSFFALDIAEFVRDSEGHLALGYVSEILIPITTVVVAISLLLAFRLNPKDVFRDLGRSAVKALKSISHFCLSLLLSFLLWVVVGRSHRRRNGIMEERHYSKRRDSDDDIIIIEEDSPWRQSNHRRSKRRASSPTRSSFARTWRDLWGSKKTTTERVERVVVEEVYRRDRSSRLSRSSPSFEDEDEVVVIEEHSPPRRRRNSDSDEVIIVEERRRSSRRRRSSSGSSIEVSKSAFAQAWDVVSGARRTREKARRARIAKRHSGYRGWIGSAPTPPKKKKWPPWAWFEKQEVPERRRSEVYVRRRGRSPSVSEIEEGMWVRCKAWLSTLWTALCALLGWKPERHSGGSHESGGYDDSSPSDTSSDRRTRRSRRRSRS